MNIIVAYIISAYSYLCEIINSINTCLEKYNSYKTFINFIGSIKTKFKSVIFNYHSDPDLPFNSNMILTNNYNLLIDYENENFGNHSLLLHKFKSDDKEYIYSKIYVNNINKFNELEHIKNTHKTDHNFLAVQYTHPIMNEEIILNIDKNYFAIGNDILDSTFIKYFLSKNYHESQYIFDKNYTLNVIDKDCSFHTIDFFSYINFCDDKWIIKKK
tara:strand:- start:804 stop:1448 length:645 start_codon:yes stop_codon:yes gene_type:complete